MDKTTLWENVKSRAIYIQLNCLEENKVTPCYESFWKQSKGIEGDGWELAIALTEELERIHIQLSKLEEKTSSPATIGKE